MATIFDSMKIQKVFYSSGTFPDDMVIRLREAPFDLVIIPALDNSEFARPVVIAGAFYGRDLNNAAFSDGIDEPTLQNGEGYTTQDYVVIIGEHEMGDMSDSWKGVHRFAWI
jgi:hypothetical protein